MLIAAFVRCITGLRELVQGLPYVELAQTFAGFKPHRGGMLQKIAVHRDMTEKAAAIRCQSAVRSHFGRIFFAQCLHEKRDNDAAAVLAPCIKGFLARFRFRVILATHRRSVAAVTHCQAGYRGILGRRHAEQRRAQVKVQRKMRHITRAQVHCVL